METEDKVDILIVDDSNFNLIALEALLYSPSQNIIKAKAGDVALKYLDQYDFAVILLDVQMPIMDGFQIAEKIRKHQRAEHTPIIFLTAAIFDETEVCKGYSIGAVDYIFKPFVPQILKAKVAVFVDLFRKTEALKHYREQEFQALKALREVESRFKKLAESTMIGVIMVDLNGRINEANDFFLKMTGYQRNELETGEVRWDRMTPPEYRQFDELAIEDLNIYGTFVPYEKEFIRKDGIHTPILIGGTFLEGSKEKCICFVVDLTERKQIERSLRKAHKDLEKRTEQLEELNKELESFSYSISHDLQAPLRAINGYSEILLEEYGPSLDEEAKRFLDKICKNTRHMKQLIDDLLAFSRCGRKEFQTQKINMSALVQSVISDLIRTPAENPNIITLQSLPSSQGDSAMMRQVFQNLLSNAVKFTRNRSEIKITVGGYSNGDENIYFVEDNGVGFDMQYSDKLFNVFHRLHNEKDFEGTGVGLAIVKRIVERHNGRVWADSKLNEGTTFYFTLPIQREIY